MRIETTYDEVKAELEQIVAEKGADYTYTIPVDNTLCVYFHAGEPSCIVGHWLARHGVTEEEVGGRNSSSVSELVGEQSILVDTAGAILLQTVQSDQDTGYSWGQALRDAIEQVEGERS